MTPQQQATAAACLNGAETGAMDFPAIVGQLIAAGFESYSVDFRRARNIYYLPSGDSLELAAHDAGTPVAAALDAASLQAAIREAQTNAPGYTYPGFCRKAARAGCAGYIVSFSGRRAVYFGRTGETHVEHFPD
ncbi:MAG: DUF1398 family protein [Acidobacteria bacterium]|nr:DUF1398 family protein [Acidobacteriota bacterium]